MTFVLRIIFHSASAITRSIIFAVEGRGNSV
jgi:hypothetical protein